MPNPDPSAFLTRFLPAEADLRAFIGALVREPGAREDIFQEVALTLWEKFAEYEALLVRGAGARGGGEKSPPRPAKGCAVSGGALARGDGSRRGGVTAVAAAGFDRPAEALKACLVPAHAAGASSWRCATRDGLRLDIAGRVGMAADAAYQALSAGAGRARPLHPPIRFPNPDFPSRCLIHPP
ncbi:MAG: hypothetical protein R3F11_13010 [Verrucomicrobiales bacterium]